jgi:hypothetical protein
VPGLLSSGWTIEKVIEKTSRETGDDRDQAEMIEMTAESTSIKNETIVNRR